MRESGQTDPEVLTRAVAGRSGGFEALPLELKSEWRRAVAEELLLIQARGDAVPPGLAAEFADDTPFAMDDPVPLRDCLSRPSARAVFPLAGRGGANPGLGHAWIIDGVSRRKPFQGDAGIVPHGCSAFFVTTAKDWDGGSWRLAGSLAAKALNHGHSRLAGDLATRWIATGDTDSGGRIRRVELGNKLELDTRGRDWMIPWDNLKDLPADVGGKVIRGAFTIDDAWAILTGAGVHAGASEPWPGKVDELHALIGGNLKAQLASAFLCPRGTPIHLWHSGNLKSSEMPARAMEIIIRKRRPTAEVATHHLDSSDMVAAERTLRERFDRLAHGKTVIFNITSGNRLMSYAIQSIAMSHANLRLIYRDINAAPFEFTALDYSQRPAAVGKMTGGGRKADSGLGDKAWNFLFSYKSPSTMETAEALAEEYLTSLTRTDA